MPAFYMNIFHAHMCVRTEKCTVKSKGVYFAADVKASLALGGGLVRFKMRHTSVKTDSSGKSECVRACNDVYGAITAKGGGLIGPVLILACRISAERQ